MTSNLTETIIELEHKTWQALQKTGADLLPFLSQDCQMLFPLGMRVTHTSVPNLTQVMTSEAFEPWATYHMKEVEVTSVGEDGAIISYKAEATKSADAPTFRALISSIWRRDSSQSAGEWLMCCHQQTPYDHEI